MNGVICIGLCRVDLDEGHRKYEVKYALNDKDGVAALLRDIHRLRERRFHAGDYSAVDILMDLNKAIVKSELTDRQVMAINWIYEHGYTQKDTAAQMEVSQQAVQQFIDGGLTKIARVFADWDYGEIILTVEESLDEPAEI